MAIYISPEMIYRWIINALALLLVASIVDGVSGKFGSLLVAAAVLGLVNAWVRPIVLFLTLPINVMSLGLFTLVINGLMLWLTSAIVPNFFIRGFLSAVWASLLLSVISALISVVVRQR